MALPPYCRSRSGLWLSGAIALLLSSQNFGSQPIAHAQTVTADGTTTTNVVATPAVFVITGGDTAGGNLFHSFQDFSPETHTTLFNVSGGGIERVISRVTGTNISTINGVLQVNGGNSPDFFLINPNGIVFGSNAILNVPGSFLASTAESIQFADGSEFSATGTTLLSVTAPTGLGMGSNPGNITNASTFTTGTTPIGLLVGAGGTQETLGLVGGEVNLTGGALTTLGGRIEVGAVGANETVDLTTTSTGYELDYRNINSFADINLTQGALVNSSSAASGAIQLRGDRVTVTEGARVLAATLGTAAQGDITVTARDVEISDRGTILSTTSGIGAGANLTFDVSESLTLTGIGYEQLLLNFVNFGIAGTLNPNNLGASIFSIASGSGAAGKITINSPTLNVQAGSLIGNTTFSTGAAGDISIQATQRIRNSGSVIFAGTGLGSMGTGGNIMFSSPLVELQNGGLVNVSALGAGQGGDITANTQTLTLNDGRTSLPPSTGFAFLDGAARTAINSTTTGTGDAGDINITTRTLHVAGGAAIETRSSKDLQPNAGQGGQLNITATESVVIEGRLADGSTPSALDVSTTSTSAAGDLKIKTKQLIVQDGAQINASTLSSGESGRIDIQVSDAVILRNQSVLTTSALGSATGAGGDISITAGTNLQLLNQSQITATTNQGNGGNLNLTAGDMLLLRQGSLISATAGQAGGSGNGGNITISAPVIAGYENSDIVANAFAGNGGNITITTQGIFGLAFREQLTADNDITASSQFGVNGTITVNDFSLDPSSGLVNLALALADSSEQVDNTCAAAGQNEFIATGRGGVPPTAEAQSGNDRPWSDLRDLSSFLNTPAPAPKLLTTSPEVIREATGFQRLANGQVVLLAESGAGRSQALHATCAIGGNSIKG
ncbi:MAG: S-layer family protein [Spirulina sp. SIO3F2]|nr:S-layer family protein [Spirulina sp. SIO3F2]